MSDIDTCPHLHKTYSRGFKVCTDCGLCLEHEMVPSRDSAWHSEFMYDIPPKYFPSTTNKSLIRATRLDYLEAIKERNWFPTFMLNPIKELLFLHERLELERVYFILKKKMRYIRFKSLIFILYFIVTKDRRAQLRDTIEEVYDLGSGKWARKATDFKYHLKKKYGLEIWKVLKRD